MKYWYWVCPVDKLGKVYADSTKYNVGYASAPTLKTITPSASDGSSASSVIVSWSSVSGTYQYHVYRSSSTAWSKRVRIAVMSSSSTSYTDNSVTKGVKYWYWVCPVDDCGKIYADSTKYDDGYIKSNSSSSSGGSQDDDIKEYTYEYYMSWYEYYMSKAKTQKYSVDHHENMVAKYPGDSGVLATYQSVKKTYDTYINFAMDYYYKAMMCL